MRKQYMTSFFLSIFFGVYGGVLLNAPCHASGQVVSENSKSLKQHRINSIPYISQKPNYCTLTSVEMVLKYYGINAITQDDIAADLKSHHGIHSGTHYQHLSAYLQRQEKQYDFKWKIKNGDLETLKHYLDSNIPVVVTHWYTMAKQSAHSRLAIGYDDEKKHVICNDPMTRENFIISYSEFMEMWDLSHRRPGCGLRRATKNQMIIITPGGKRN